MKRRTQYNAKRRLLAMEDVKKKPVSFSELASLVQYGGNPEHKRDPGDFALSPPHAGGRPAKSLCDDAGVLRRKNALELLRSGLTLGLVSDRFDGEWPYNVWMVTAEGQPLEAQLERPGVYHGYPMPDADPFRGEVLKRWRQIHE
jgi:hypothetical protein